MKAATMPVFVSLCSLYILLDVLQLVECFRGAVFEHVQQSHANSSRVPNDIIRENLEFYQNAARVAKSKNVEVIVFPEYGLFPPIEDRQELRQFLEFVPDPQTTPSNPCQESQLFLNRPILYTLSCLARENKLILVANMGDIQPCHFEEKDCPQDGAFYYNTNVVFDQNGTIIARYHKEHLFGERGMNTPPLGKQDPTFYTSLGRFATFVCFDIIFHRIVEVSHWEGIQAVLFPTYWLDNTPLFVSIQHFQAWSIGNDVPILAANNHLPGIYSIGSGITRGKDGALVYTFNPDGKSKLLIADMGHDSGYSAIYTVDKDTSEKFTDDGKDVKNECSVKVLGPTRNLLSDYRCLERDLTNFTLVKLTEDRDELTHCNNGFCCSLNYSAQLVEDYFMGIYNGTFIATGINSWPEENCFLARCDGLHDKACVTFPMRSETLFFDVHLKAQFSTNYVYPTMVTSGMRLVPTEEWNFKNDKISQTVSISFEDSKGKKLLTAGLKGRPYDRDNPGN